MDTNGEVGHKNYIAPNDAPLSGRNNYIATNSPLPPLNALVKPYMLIKNFTPTIIYNLYQKMTESPGNWTTNTKTALCVNTLSSKIAHYR